MIKRDKEFLNRAWSWIFVLPTIVFLGFSYVYPMLYSLVMSLFYWNMLIPNSEKVFVGLQNYARIFREPDILASFKTTLVFVVVAVAIEFFVGLAIAALATANLKIVNVFRISLLVPMMMPPVVAGVLWRNLYNSQYGVINYFFNLVGLPSQTWLGNVKQALPSVIAVEIWQQLPVVIFIVAAGIQSISIDLYKAALVDGCTKWQIFKNITLPLLKPVIVVVLLLRIMDAFKVFDIIYTLTQGGPGSATKVVSLMIYHNGLKYFQIGRASAESWVFLLLILAISIYFIRTIQRRA